MELICAIVVGERDFSTELCLAPRITEQLGIYIPASREKRRVVRNRQLEHDKMSILLNKFNKILSKGRSRTQVSYFEGEKFDQISRKDKNQEWEDLLKCIRKNPCQNIAGEMKVEAQSRKGPGGALLVMLRAVFSQGNCAFPPVLFWTSKFTNAPHNLCSYK